MSAVTDINLRNVLSIMASDEIVDSVIDYLEISDRHGFVTRLAHAVDDDTLMSITRDVLLDRLMSTDLVYVIENDIETTVSDMIDDMNSRDDDSCWDEFMEMDITPYQMLKIAESFRDIVALEDLGFIDDASRIALSVASAMVEVAKIPKFASESVALLQSAEEIRADVGDGCPAEWFRMDIDDIETDDEDFF